MTALNREVEARGLRNVQFRPCQPRERLAQSLGACHAHCVTLRPQIEGLVVPSKFYSIIAAARPVLFVGAAGGELQSLIREGECGAVFEPEHARALAECIVRLAGDAPLERRWGEDGRALFERRFDQRIGVARWEQVLSDVSRS